MSFRLRIFLLVMVVAVTAIGATAWLTLSLTSRELNRAQQASERHRAEIRDTVQRYGVTHGRWSGIDVVVRELSQRTGLHIQVTTVDGERLADSDNLEGRAEGPVQSVPITAKARPRLSEEILLAADSQRATDLASGKLDPNAKELYRAGKVSLQRPKLPRDLFAAEPPDSALESPLPTVLRQLAQYRAALRAINCTGDADALASDTAPYLSREQLADDARCVRTATEDILSDTGWLQHVWSILAKCGIDPRTFVVAGCLVGSFEAAADTTAISSVDIHLGAPPAPGVSALGQPAAFGVAGLIVVAVLGTAWIARRVSHPVWRLTEASRQLADGRLDVRVPAAGKGELARLSASFNAMAEAVQQSEERQRRLVADVAHEMRTPLSNLRGYLEGLSDGVVQPSRELFASLHEETMLQRRILDDLQVLALAEAGNLGYTKLPIDLAELAGAGATAHRAVAKEAGIALTVDVPAPQWVQADPDRLRQVLGNLLTNAIRYTDAGGHVLVRVREQNHEAVLTVRDTGVGITPADLSRVFDRFWRADPARQRATGGTGLGLTIAHRIVTDHGGRIEVISEPGDGTTFTVRLPLHAPAGTGQVSAGQGRAGQGRAGRLSAAPPP